MLKADTCPKCDLEHPTSVHLQTCGGPKVSTPCEIIIRLVNGEPLTIQAKNYPEILKAPVGWLMIVSETGEEVYVNSDHVVSVVVNRK
jgi:hypothetical protein